MMVHLIVFIMQQYTRRHRRAAGKVQFLTSLAFNQVPSPHIVWQTRGKLSQLGLYTLKFVDFPSYCRPLNHLAGR